MKVKICGITRLEDALLAETLGADYIGFIFHPDSPRYITLSQAAEIAAQLTQAKPIGVFVKHSAKEVIEIAEQVGLYGVQFYSQIANELPKPLLKIQALRINDAEDLTPLVQGSAADFYLLDKHHATQFGGTGESFDWAILPKYRDNLFLAGGICHDNVKAAVALKPYAIDISSGVESSPGIKDPVKLRQLFKDILA
ncbi:MAG: phosphoribosylanthranilate isomerase [Gammaproteobacteria bacterium]|nr:phosphoribosylanthranilate isomerase [Gammaproteobacteria bacterium]